ncbi:MULTISPECIES: ribosome maturation factor RimM [unclassified Aminobacter]|uniref:ribosome maturation factor RimM n=1 Tax=unclassified Aminobacter TaxID=2644704 RepID=UPI000467850F|nr:MULTISPECIES: ribosome maturation factor RimM [unclassified Aminobacter]TWG50075.1 16S rRNA processing protein RimM [Aminobacter sp. J44]TWH35397.1 16S rRNA processing protein RimM [Aminobacter sp. J15]
MKKLDKPVQMAVIGAPHGVKGELRVKTFTADPLALGDYGPLTSEDGRTFTVAAIRPAKNIVVVRFKEVTTREQAEAVNGVALYVDRSVLPDEELDEEEFFHADLIGLEIRDETGAKIGKVIAIQNFGGGDILEANLSGRRSVMIPFTLAAIPEVSVSGGYIRIDSVAAGLVDDEDEEEGEAE